MARPKLPAYTLHGYPIIYITKDGDCFCAKCASKAANRPNHADVYYEGDTLFCDDCGKGIESAYGPVDQ